MIKHAQNINSLLKGLIKAVHPDKFALADKKIQISNLNCVQNLNGLLDFVDKVGESLDQKRQFTVTSPLPVKYNTQCYINATDSFNKRPAVDAKESVESAPKEGHESESSSAPKYRPTKFILTPPKEFTMKQHIITSATELQLSATELYYGIVDAYTVAALKHPLITVDEEEEAAYRRKQRQVEDQGGGAGDDAQTGRDGRDSSVLPKSVEAKFYDAAYRRWVQLEVEEQRRQKVAAMFEAARRGKAAAAGRAEEEHEDGAHDGKRIGDVQDWYDRAAGRSGVEGGGGGSRGAGRKKSGASRSVRSSSGRLRGSHSSGNSSAPQHRSYLERIRDVLSEQVDLYIASGNLLVDKSIQVVYEAERSVEDGASKRGACVQRQHQKRTGSRYTEMEALDRFRQFVLLHGSLVHFNMEDYRNVVICLHAKDVSGDPHVEGDDAGTKVEVGPQPPGYKCIRHKQFYILDVPVSFKSKELLRYMQDHLPVANILTYNVSSMMSEDSLD